MSNEFFVSRRKSYMSIGDIFFWTATINQWQLLLWDDKYKNVITNSLRYLTEKGILDVFAFVIMPNHVHVIWRTNELNGKESGQGSFLKFTAHEFRKLLLNEDTSQLKRYAVPAYNKRHEFWQRDPLAIHLYTEKVACQKLNYIHNNPISERWQLVNDPCDYIYSSAAFYEKGEKHYDFSKDLRYEF